MPRSRGARRLVVQLLGLACALLLAAHGAAAPSLHNLTPVVEAAPREVVSLFVRVQNGPRALELLTPRIDLPPGWRLLAPPGKLSLDAGETRTMSASLLVGREAKAGVYSVPFNLEGARDGGQLQTAFTVRVKEVRRLEASVLEAPAVVLASPYRARFAVSNTGNAVEMIDLAVTTTPQLATIVAPSFVSLDPGATREIEVTVEHSAGSQEARRHQLRLVARNRGQPDARAVADTTVEVVPQRLNPLAAYHTFPLTMRLKGAVGTETRLENAADAASRFGVEVSGSGRLWEDDPGNMSVHLSRSFDFRRSRHRLQYRHPAFLAVLGDQEIALSPLTEVGTRFGVRGSTSHEIANGLTVGATLAAFRSSGGVGVGAGVSTELGEHVEVSAQLLNSSRDSQASARVQISPDALFSDGSPSVHLDAEYGVRLFGEGAFPATALRTTGRMRNGRASIDASYERVDARYDRSGHDRTQLEANAKLQLDENPGTSHAALSVLSVHYDNEIRIAPPPLSEGPDALVHYGSNYGAALSGHWGPVALTLEYDRERKTHLEAHTTDQAQALRASARLPLAQGLSLKQQVGWQHDLIHDSSGRSASHGVTYRASGSMSRGPHGTFEPSVGVTYDLNKGALDQMDFGMAWTGSPTPALSLQASGELHLHGPELAEFAASGTYGLNDGHAIDFDVRGRTFRDRRPNARLELGYAFPVTIPLHRLSSVGEVSGIITGEDGKGISGVTLELAGLQVASGPNGRFRFPAVPAGEKYLRIRPGALAPGQLVTPALPHLINLAPGATVTLALQVMQAARVEGHLRMAKSETESPQGSDAAALPMAADPISLQGVLVELTNGTTTYRSLTNRNGSFVFETLLPGQWELRVQPGTWPEEYRLDDPVRIFTLQATETKRVEVQVMFRARNIRFLDGGTVRSGED